jgi:hypothetical protein
MAQFASFLWRKGGQLAHCCRILSSRDCAWVLRGFVRTRQHAAPLKRTNCLRPLYLSNYIDTKRNKARERGVESLRRTVPLAAHTPVMTSDGNGLPVEARERLERIVIELVGIATRREIDPSLRDELMRLAAKISSLLEESNGPTDQA